LPRDRRVIVSRIVEALLLIVVVGSLSHLLIDSPRPGDFPWRLAAALLSIAALFIASYWRRGRADTRSVDLWIVVGSLAFGFWLFALLRYTGFARWPLARVETLHDYVVLLVSHLILVGTVFSCLLWMARGRASFAYLTWGDWRGGRLGIWGRRSLLSAAIGAWIWALYTAISLEPAGAEALSWFLAIALAKAMLTGVAEEAAYRGIIQPAAIRRFGVPVGIVVQSCLYTALHLHLGPVLWGRPGFLLAVMLLGLTFGVVTRATGGIGWACAVHVAINGVIELQNVS
jgi:membrane protease YdiL (CAAX protease family)